LERKRGNPNRVLGDDRREQRDASKEYGMGDTASEIRSVGDLLDQIAQTKFQDEWGSHVKSSNPTMRCFRIPKEAKPKIRRELELMNFNEFTVYGGLDHLANWLKRAYAVK
jgi:hypothetical protein